ncbi:MAG: DUF2441 domain-containing protein [Ruminococcaceae bacterium]|nr:DUF2441 domain-containing protein [Oscillospiraceae bacterium]
MQEHTFYHVVTDRPMTLHQRILFDQEHHSGVWQRVMDKLPIVEEIYANPEAYRDVTLEHHTDVALRELALEEVRLAEYPQYPSRMACLYVSKTLKESEDWFDFFTRIGRPTFQIVKLRVRGNVFEGDAVKCFDGTPDHEENLRMARRYWKNDPADDEERTITEVLVDGELEVVEIVKSIL